jgi:6-phosphogluconolactonase (cycloisomerase 2 family)
VVVDATEEYVYVADTTNKTIAAHKTSDLGLIGAPYDVTGGVLSLATDPQTTLVYALGTNTITPILTQTVTGTLSVPATGQTFPGTWVAGAVSPGGKFLAAVDSSTNKIQVFSITPVRGAATDGVLLKVGSGVAIPGAKTVSSVAFDPLGRFVVVTDSKANTVTPFTIDSTGKLTAGTALTTPTGATQAVIDPNGLFLFVGVFGDPTASRPVAGGVQVYTISTTGALTAVGTPVDADLGTWGLGVLNTVQ